MSANWELLIVFGVGIVAIGMLVGMAVVATYLKHRETMAKLGPTNAAPDAKLLERINTLERRCERLEAQAAETQLQLLDEQRQLDRKLSGLLDAPASARTEMSVKN